MDSLLARTLPSYRMDSGIVQAPRSSFGHSQVRDTYVDITEASMEIEINLDDATWKDKIPYDWQNYAMFISHGPPGERKERCLSYDEKPLALFRKLKERQGDPVFMLRHIRDIPSPIDIAQRKHAARKASQSGTSTHDAVPNRPGNAAFGVGVAHAMKSASALSTSVLSGGAMSRSGNQAAGDDAPLHGTVVSHAVAVFPYTAEHEDEFDIVVGDTFVVVSKKISPGWRFVQRDPTGTGEIELDINKQGWVAAGCLLETSVPVAIAIAEAQALTSRILRRVPSASTMPLLPLYITSTGYPGIVMMTFRGGGEQELDIVQGDALKVFKRYNHWFYAVKEESGDRGWVPSWFIGRVDPATGFAPRISTTSLHLVEQSPASPVSPLFPTEQRQEPCPQPSKRPTVSINDPAWKVLPVALKKFKIVDEEWQKYVIIICYGPADKRMERCVRYDEQPLSILKKFKDAKKDPVLTVKHIRDISSPIELVQQKHTTHDISNPGASTPCELVQSLEEDIEGIVTEVARLAPLAAASDSSLDHSSIEERPRSRRPSEATSPGASGSVLLRSPVSSGGRGRATLHSRTGGVAAGDAGEIAISIRVVSYAVAIYPFLGERDGEFDVAVGDTYVVVSSRQVRGWCIVQHDLTGAGDVGLDVMKQGWVPAGCLLEMNMPISAAVVQAQAAASRGLFLATAASCPLPILPTSIMSKSSPRIALMHYQKRAPEELALEKGDNLRVFKTFNYWTYAVKEGTGDRGWAPSWFLGQLSTSTPPTTP